MERPLDVNRRQPCFGLSRRAVVACAGVCLCRVILYLRLALASRVAISWGLARATRIGVLVCAEDSAADGQFDQGRDRWYAGGDDNRVGFDAILG